MKIIYFVIPLIPALLLFGLGYLIRFRKAYWLISGYNTMSAEKKKNVDTEGLGNLMGNMCFVMGAVLFAGFLLLFLKQTIAGFCIFGLFILVIIYTIAAAQKYDGNTRTNEGKMKRGSKVTVIIVILAFLLVPGFVGVLLYQGMQPVTATFDKDSLTIDGSYGQTVLFTDMKAIQLIETMPEIQLRTNGASIGNICRGHFRLAEVGTAMLYLDTSQALFIYIETSQQKIYLNLATIEETRQLYNELETQITSKDGVRD